MKMHSVNLIILYSSNPEGLVKFYRQLGFEFREERHPGGPTHWASEKDGIVFEIYPGEQVSAKPNFGIMVNQIAEIKEAVIEQRGRIKQIDEKTIIVTDPDGNRLIFTEE